MKHGIKHGIKHRRMAVDVRLFLLSFSLLGIPSEAVRGASSTIFETPVTVGDAPYIISCECDMPEGVGPAFGSISGVKECNQHGGIVHTEKPSSDEGMMLAEDVERQLGQARQYSLVNTESFPFYCADDRVNTAAPFTLGGEAGEFLMALQMIEEHSTDFFDERNISQLILQWISVSKVVFVYCTDELSMDHLEGQSQMKIGSLSSLNEGGQRAVLESMTKHYSNFGDALFRNLFKDPVAYNIRPELCSAFIRALFNLHWQESKLPILILTLIGDRAPLAVVEIEESDACFAKNQTAIFRPQTSSVGGQFYRMLLLNTKAVKLRRQQLATFFAANPQGSLPLTAPADPTLLYTRLNSLADHWAEATVLAAFPSQPIYTLELTA